MRLIVAGLGVLGSSVWAIGNDIQYRVVDLGAMGASQSTAYGINNLGQVIGWCGPREGRPDWQPFLYDSGNFTPLSAATDVYGINDAGQMFGGNSWYENATSSRQPLAALGDYFDAHAINVRGHVIGWSSVAPDNLRSHAFLSLGTVSAVDLGSLDSDGNSSALGLNDADEVVGYAGVRTATGWIHHAFVWRGSGPMVDLGTLGGPESGASDINNYGDIVGTSDVMGDTVAHVFAYRGDGPMRDLGTLPGHLCVPRDLNNRGSFVGNADQSAFIGQLTGGLQDLNDLIDPASHWTLKTAVGINDSGWIVGTGINPLGQSQAYLLVPIPEPTYTLAPAFIAIASRRSGRRRKSMARDR